MASWCVWVLHTPRRLTSIFSWEAPAFCRSAASEASCRTGPIHAFWLFKCSTFLLLGVAPFGPCSFTGVRTHPQGCRCRVTPALTVLRYAISFYNTATLCPTSKIIRAASCNLAGVPHASSRQLSLHASRSLPLHSCFVAVPLRAATAPSEAIMYFFSWVVQHLVREVQGLMWCSFQNSQARDLLACSLITCHGCDPSPIPSS